MILTMYPNIVVFLLISGYLVLTKSNGWIARVFIACLGLAFSAGFWAINLRNNVIYIAIFVVITFSLTYALLQEFKEYSSLNTPTDVDKCIQQQPRPQPAQLMMVWPLRPLRAEPDPAVQPPPDLTQIKPHPIMICGWWAFLLVFPVYTIYIAISHTTRDIMGVAVFGTLGYVTALMLQRFYWTFWYIQEKQNMIFTKQQHTETVEIQWTMGYRTAYVFVDYPRVVLLVGSLLTGLFLSFLSYVHGLPHSPYRSSTAIFPLTLGLAIMFGPVEVWNQMGMCKYMSTNQVLSSDPYKPVSWIDTAQLLSLSLANLVFAALVIDDSVS